MSPQLGQALKRPSMVIQAGPEKGARNSTKKASGLMRFGASIMLGAALLSPFNALAAQQNHLQAQQQGSEMVQEQSGMEVMTSGQVEEMIANGQKPDWFNIEVEGRTWHNWSQVGENNISGPIDVPTWIRHGQVMSPGQDVDADISNIEIGDGLAKEATVEAGSESNSYYESRKAEREAEKVQARIDAPSFSLSRNEYNLYKRIDLGGEAFSQASEAQQQAFVARLAKDAYIEMKAGHSVEAPSQRLVDICQQVKDIAPSYSSNQIEHGNEVFTACQSEQMQSSMLSNRVKKVAGYVGAGIGVILAKTLAAGAFVTGGGLLLGGGANDGTARPRSRINTQWNNGSDPNIGGPEPEADRPAPRLG